MVSSTMRYVVWSLIALVTVLHQLPVGSEPTPLFAGVIPLGLLFHAVLSVVASLLWWLAVTFCWPNDAEVEPLETSPEREANA